MAALPAAPAWRRPPRGAGSRRKIVSLRFQWLMRRCCFCIAGLRFLASLHTRRLSMHEPPASGPLACPDTPQPPAGDGLQAAAEANLRKSAQRAGIGHRGVGSSGAMPQPAPAPVRPNFRSHRARWRHEAVSPDAPLSASLRKRARGTGRLSTTASSASSGARSPRARGSASPAPARAKNLFQEQTARQSAHP